MTLADRVVAHLRATRGRWRRGADGAIRDRYSCECPLESLLALGSESLGFPERSKPRAEIMRAADNEPSHDGALRRRMLRAAGLA